MIIASRLANAVEAGEEAVEMKGTASAVPNSLMLMRALKSLRENLGLQNESRRDG